MRTGLVTTNRLKIPSSKFALTLITPYNREYNAKPRVTLFNALIPASLTSERPFSEILGVIYGRSMMFKQQTDNIHTKAKTCLNVPRALTQTTFGHSKEDITTLYRHFIRSNSSKHIMVFRHSQCPHTLTATMQNIAPGIVICCTRTTPNNTFPRGCQVLYSQ